MDKKNKLIISIGIVIIIVATILIITLVDGMTEDKVQPNTGYYTLQPTTTQPLPVATDSWIDLNLIASDLATATDTSSTDVSGTNVITTMGNAGGIQGYFFDAFGNLIDANGNIIIPANQLQGNNGNSNQGGNNSQVPGTTVDNTQAFDTPVTDESELAEYEIDEKGVITKYLGDKTNILLPKTIQGKQVTGIGAECFRGSAIKTIQIPETVTVIETNAFRDCARLTDVVFVNENVEVIIGTSAFENCDSLTNVSLPRVWLYNTAFAKCDSLKNVKLAPGSKQIGSYCFSDCPALEYVHVPTSVEAKNIGTNVFSGSNTELYVVASETSPAYKAFYDMGIKVTTHE